jgi:AraC-like DNA-binding protein
MRAAKAYDPKLHPIEAFGLSFAAKGDIRVDRLEHRLAPKVAFPHRHGFFHFIYLTRGGGWHEIDFQRFEVRPQQLYFVKPGEVHSWQLNAHTRGFVLEFTRESLPKTAVSDALFRALESLPSSHSGMGHLLPLLELMNRENSERKAQYKLCLEHYLSGFLLLCTRLQNAREKALPRSGVIESFQKLLETNYMKEHGVDFYANSLATSAKSLSSLTKRLTGKSAGALIQERCLAEAKRLLAYSGKSVADIGYELGFEDPNYFARFFRKHEGMAPGQFRKRSSHSVS